MEANSESRAAQNPTFFSSRILPGILGVVNQWEMIIFSAKPQRYHRSKRVTSVKHLSSQFKANHGEHSSSNDIVNFESFGRVGGLENFIIK